MDATSPSNDDVILTIPEPNMLNVDYIIQGKWPIRSPDSAEFYAYVLDMFLSSVPNLLSVETIDERTDKLRVKFKKNIFWMLLKSMFALKTGKDKTFLWFNIDSKNRSNLFSFLLKVLTWIS